MSKDARQTWEQILAVLDEKMQFAFLEQASAVTKVELDGEELTLSVNTDEARDFFSANVNQQRIFIVSRPITAVEKITAIEKIKIKLVEE